MADFIDDEAELSSNESSVDDDDEAEIKKKSKLVKRNKVSINDDEDEEEEEDNNNENLEDLIDDNPVDDNEGSEGSVTGKRSHDSEDDDEEVDDEDYDLLEDNLGIKIKRTHKRRRVRMESDDEDEKLSHDDPGRDKELIGNDLFDDADADVAASEASFNMRREQNADDLAISEEESEEDVNDFIVDDDDRPIVSKKTHKKRVHDDAAMQEAYELFGPDITFEDLAEMDDDDEEEEDEELEVDEDDVEAAATRAAKAARKKKAKTTIYQVIEPSELERGHYTDYDQNIRMTDLPERFQLRHIPVCSTEEGELEDESEWIYRNAFATPPLSKQNYFEQERGFNAPQRKGPNIIVCIREALNLMRNQKFEVPFIAFYRKEFIDPELNIIDLWKVYHWDEKWMDLKMRKQNLVKLMEQMQQFQYENVSHDKPLESSFRRLPDEDIERLKSVQSLVELKDVQQHFMLYYGKEIALMKISHKKSEAVGEETAEDDQDHVKYATRKSVYTLCVDAGIGEVARRFGLTAEQFGENLRDNYQQHEVDQEIAEPAELADEFKKGQFSTSDLVLAGARHVVATQIAYDPVVRNCVRTTFYERCKLSVKPTKKKKVPTATLR